MSAILKFDFQKRKQLRFSEVNYLLHKKDPILHVATTFSLKQGETRTSHGPIPTASDFGFTSFECCLHRLGLVIKYQTGNGHKLENSPQL